MNKSILVVEDDEDIRFLVRHHLEKEGYKVFEAENGAEGVEQAKQITPDLVLLDVMMPVMDGMEACEKMRALAELDSTLICFLTARGEDYSQIIGFESGADDYIVKPIKPKVLSSRIKALLKRRVSYDYEMEGKSAEDASLWIDHERYILVKAGENVILPRKEFQLISLLMSKPDKVFHRDEILNKVWGEDVVVNDRTIDVHVRKLREKIGNTFIQTVKGVGYRFHQ